MRSFLIPVYPIVLVCEYSFLGSCGEIVKHIKRTGRNVLECQDIAISRRCRYVFLLPVFEIAQAVDMSFLHVVVVVAWHKANFVNTHGLAHIRSRPSVSLMFAFVIAKFHFVERFRRLAHIVARIVT